MAVCCKHIHSIKSCNKLKYVQEKFFTFVYFVWDEKGLTRGNVSEYLNLFQPRKQIFNKSDPIYKCFRKPRVGERWNMTHVMLIPLKVNLIRQWFQPLELVDLIINFQGLMKTWVLIFLIRRSHSSLNSVSELVSFKVSRRIIKQF